MSEYVANIVEVLGEMESSGQFNYMHARIIRDSLAKLYDRAMEKHIMLQEFVGMAQERTCPELPAINRARAALGMEPLKELPGWSEVKGD